MEKRSREPPQPELAEIPRVAVAASFDGAGQQPFGMPPLQEAISYGVHPRIDATGRAYAEDMGKSRDSDFGKSGGSDASWMPSAKESGADAKNGAQEGTRRRGQEARGGGGPVSKEKGAGKEAPAKDSPNFRGEKDGEVRGEKSRDASYARHGKGDASGSGSQSWGQDKLRGEGRRKPVPLSALKDFKAAIFDLDGVLVDSEKAHLETFRQAFSSSG